MALPHDNLWIGLQCMTVEFPDYTHLLFCSNEHVISSCACSIYFRRIFFSYNFDAHISENVTFDCKRFYEAIKYKNKLTCN